MLLTDGVVGRVVTSVRFLSWGERESGGLLDMSGEEVMVMISTPGVEGDMDRFKLVMESERGDMMLTVWVAVWLVVVMLSVLPEPILVLLLLSPPVTVFTDWLAVVVLLAIMVVLALAWVAARSAVVMDLMLLVVVTGTGLGVLVACLNLTSVLPYLTLGSGLGSGVERGGGDDVGDVLGDGDGAAAAVAGLAGDILSLERSGMMVWGSGIMGRMGRIGAAEREERGGLAGGVLAGEGGALTGGLASRALGCTTEISSSLTSSTELSRVTRLGELVVTMSSACSLPVLLAGPLWPTWLLLEFWNSSNMALNLSQLLLVLVMVSIWSPLLPMPTLPLWPLMRSGFSCLVTLPGLSDLVMGAGGGGLGALPIGGVFLGGAVNGSLARTDSRSVVVTNILPVVWPAISTPPYSSTLVSVALWLVTTPPSIISMVTLLTGSTLKPGTSEPSIFLPEAEPGQASGGSLECQSRPWPPSLVQEQFAEAGRLMLE